MGTTALLIGEDNVDGLGPFLLHRILLVGRHLAHVIGIAYSHIAFTLEDGLNLRPVIALRLARQICLNALGPGGGALGTLGDDDRGQQGDIIDMLARTNADPALHLGIGQILIGGHLAGLDPVLGGVDDPGAHGQTKPVTVGMAVLHGDIGRQFR